MKITYLLRSTSAKHGPEREALDQAADLRADHDVQVIAVFQTKDAPAAPRGLAVQYLVDQRGEVPRPSRHTDLGPETWSSLAASPSSLLPTAWSPAYNALTDIEAEARLDQLDTDILITAAMPALALVAQLRPAGVLHVHQVELDPDTWTAQDEPLLRFAPRLDALITTTRYAADWLTDSLGAAVPLVVVDPWRLPTGMRLRSSLANPTILLADQLETGHHIDQAIKAFAGVAGEFPDWSLRIFGDGPAGRSLARLIEALGLQDQVYLLGHTEHLAEELAKASLRLVTGAGAGSGRAQAEAFAAGVPVLAYAHPGVEEFVTHDVNGHLVTPSDMGALTTALGHLMNDERARLRMGEQALATARALTAASGAGGGARRDELFERLLAGREEAAVRRADRLAVHTTRTVAGYAPAVQRSGIKTPALREEGHVLRGGRLVQVRNDLGPHDVARLNLEAVTDALRQEQIPFLALRDRGLRHRVAVTEEHRATALAALSHAFEREPMYAQPLKPKPGTPPSGLARDTATWPPAGGLRLFRLIEPSTRTLQFGHDCGCDLEFWTPTAHAGYTAPLPTLIGDAIPPEAVEAADLTVGDRVYPSLRAYTQTLADEADFPIDAVYTWVDGADPSWRSRREAALSAAGLRPSNADGGQSRYSSRDELRYSLRSLAMHAPWIRQIWVVTDQQTPAWLNTDHPNVTIVDHRDIFTDPDALPTFNSHAIETQLHHIDGLADHFLYLNDDFFLGRPLTPEHFFHASGLTKFFTSGTTIPPGPRTERDASWLAAAKNNRALIEREFGRGTVQAFKHAPYALRRSVLDELEHRFPGEIAATARNRIRCTRDVSLVSSLYHYYGLCTGQAISGELSVDTVPLSHSRGMPALTRLLTMRDRDAFCLNDMASGDLTELEKWRAATGFLESYFPVRSPFERRS